MSKLNPVLVKLVWWTGWPLFPLVVAFLATGYTISGRFGLGFWLDERTALAWHKLLHLPLIVLVLVHSLPAMYLGAQRWGWFRKPPPP
jgi:hypothetical protein